MAKQHRKQPYRRRTAGSTRSEEDGSSLTREARQWISEGLQEIVGRFDRNTPLHHVVTASTKLAIDHPETAKLMIVAAMSGDDQGSDDPLYRLILNMLRELKADGRARADLDPETFTHILLGSFAAIIMLRAQHSTEDPGRLTERFAKEWSRTLIAGMFSPPDRAAPKRDQPQSAVRKAKG